MDPLVVSLLALIEKAGIDLLNMKSKLDKEKYENYILPIWEAFNLVHKDYKDSFIKYIKWIEEGKALDDLIMEIQQDSINTKDLRYELKNRIYASHPHGDIPDKKFESFVRDLLIYFNGRDNLFVDNEIGTISLFYEGPQAANYRRRMLIAALNADKIDKKKVEDMSVEYIKDKRDKINCINSHLSVIQDLYGDVSKDFHDIKRKFI